MGRKVSVYDNDGNVIARVEYNNELDYWDGRNWTCGQTGRHLGITRLRKSGQYVIIKGTDWQGERDRAYVVSKEKALQAILSSENVELLDRKMFAELKELYNQEIESEEG